MSSPRRILIPAIALTLVLAQRVSAAEYPVNRPPRVTPAAAEGVYAIHPDRSKQIIKGFGFEIQSDSINSGNQGISDSASSVPHDLTLAERERLYRTMLRGFRYCRLAGGLYWRGLDAEQKTFLGRWPEQMAELKELVVRSGVEGLSLEYWSPAPFWKANRRLAREGVDKKTESMLNVLRCFGPDFANDPDYKGDVNRFLNDFGDACRHDLQYLRDQGLPVSMWGLQNEPWTSPVYPACVYTPETYGRTLMAVAPKIRAFDPNVWIIADTANLRFIKPILQNDPQAAGLVDALVVHHVGSDSNEVTAGMDAAIFARKQGKPVFQNEYEYLEGPASPARCLNTVQHIMNWFQLGEAPIWFWIHALKPYKNEEASGYSLGFWRPVEDSDPAKDAAYHGLKPGHWTWNLYNWNAVGSFIRHMPWDCRAVVVTEGEKDEDLRVFAFKRPDGKLTLVLSNRGGRDHTFHVNTGLKDAVFKGWRYTPDEAGENTLGVPLAPLVGDTIAPTLSDLSWEFWEQQ